MSFSFSSLVRLLVIMAVGSTMMAVGLSRLDPPRPGSRFRQPARFINVNDYFLDVTDRTPNWLDSETGQVSPFPLKDGDVLEAASRAPWVDEKGHSQVVGRWSSRTLDGPMSMSKDFGLARYTFPGGEKLDQVSTEIVPVGPPCWFPGSRARVLFAAGDGMLYSYAFEPESWEKETDPAAGRDPKPSLLTWKCPKPGMGEVFISDLSWSDDPRMGGCAFVALREQRLTPDGLRFYSRTQLFWLKLNFAGTEVVEAGRLLRVADRRADLDREDERAPTLGTLSDGRLVLAYMSQRPREVGWRLQIAPIHLDPDTHIPRVDVAEGSVLRAYCQPASPTFSSDGRWLSVIVGTSSMDGRVIRLPTPKSFPVSS